MTVFVLDTDIIGLLQQGHAGVLRRIEACDSTVVTTAVNQAEIFIARSEYLIKASDSAQLLTAQYWFSQSLELLATFVVLPINAEATVQFERLCRTKGIGRVGRADLLIACIALAHQGVMVTRNVRDFQRVPNLKVENWAD